MKYTVKAQQGTDPHIWVLQCVELPGAISQTRRLSDAESLMREAIAFVADVSDDEVQVDVQPELPPALQERVTSARDAMQQLKTAELATSRRSREAVAALQGEGFSGVDTAAILGISPQRVSQLRASAARGASNGHSQEAAGANKGVA